ncbi:6-phospho-3-hexuloisomerase [Alkalihalobacillus sp. AL-G]|uniref:6-phospho-3-hexuloisomerase n=1 Tax=Alkalihalobacillus sp. AL-G TaxID=2926399 RepID=UPI00272D9E4E|nr:6-phospho-3-hexuloisomerase [Alkalihalobacillus sp. AL-G]WLD93335.1 6-phospho-3-hexuloisomerase [Alkalihalobacillus sp. AL-G]
MKSIITTISAEITEVLSNVDELEAVHLSEKIQNAKRIFVSGTGRSGLIGKVFAMRLMQGGYPVYVVGETITPSISSDDLLIVISGSGSTGSLLQFGTKAKEVGADLFLVTTNPNSQIADLSDGCLVIRAATKHRKPEEPETIQPLGSQFDQSAHLILDAIVVHLLKNEKDGHETNQLNQRHANLE